MTKARPENRFALKVVGDGSRHTQVLYNSRTKRATVELLSYRLPYGSTVALWRGGRKIATAEVVFEGYSGHGGDLREVFMGESFALIEPEALLMQSGHLPQRDMLYSQRISARNLARGDKLVLIIKYDHLVPQGQEKWSYERWFRNATQKSRRVALEVEYQKAAAMVMHLMFRHAHPNDLGIAERDFREARMGAPWLELLYDAVQQVGIPKPKEQTPDEIKRRLTAARADSGVVKLVMKDGQRVEGTITDFDPFDNSLKLEGKFEGRPINFTEIRRVR